MKSVVRLPAIIESGVEVPAVMPTVSAACKPFLAQIVPPSGRDERADKIVNRFSQARACCCCVRRQ